MGRRHSCGSEFAHECGGGIVPTLRVEMPSRTLRVHVDAERQSLGYHAERGNDQ